MAATKTKPAGRTPTKTTAKKGTSKMPRPAKAIGDAAVDLEHDIVAALRKEMQHLKSTVGKIQKDVRVALDRVEDALQAVVEAKPSANGKVAAKKTTAKKAATKPRSK